MGGGMLPGAAGRQQGEGAAFNGREDERWKSGKRSAKRKGAGGRCHDKLVGPKTGPKQLPALSAAPSIL